MDSIKKYHFLFLGPEAPAKVTWAERLANGRLVIGHGPLSGAGHLQGEKVVVIVSGSGVLLTEVSFGGSRSRFLKRSIPFALEENLADDVEDLHFATGPTGRDGVIPVAVVARTQMEEWLALLQEHDIEAKYLVPETMAIPLDPEGWSLVLGATSFVLRKSLWRGYGGDIGSLPIYLEDEDPVNSQSGPLLRLYLDEGCSAECEKIVPAEKITSVTRQSLVQLIGDGYNDKEAINLLQGDYSRHAGWRDLWKNWQLPMVAATLLALLSVTGFTFDYLSLKSENNALNARIKGVYLATFPASRRVVNARAQMEQKLAGLQQDAGARSSFFAVYDKAAPLLLAAPGVIVNNLRFNNGRFDFDIVIRDLQALDKLKYDLTEALGDRVDIKNAEAAGNTVKAKIQIKADGK